ncbi:TIM barrel protein [Flavobacteriaceae bacterium TP-CH-4]|uniref:TIM barrel protein n=1 Tax=Pelagihabitans pacificus TaxID=2696054 RepID=A0A967AUW2_9FLAO|nr:sugar phosphate isomerase/epimerase family protein [Pelagihabitans pacificus]NHF59473.1 TIM barrel protein [Pelagihabitans pacificus]
MKTRRDFIRKTSLGGIALGIPLPAFTTAKPSTDKHRSMSAPKISLAQWSLHRAIENGTMKAVDFPSIASNQYAIRAVEYVNQFYLKHAADQKFWLQMGQRAKDAGVQSLLIMVDDEGNLGSSKAVERKKAVENHYKWIDAAKLLGCHSIRVNAFGEGTRQELYDALIDGLGNLAAYGAKENINVLIENHGLHTSDGKFMVGILKQVNSPFLGTLPDFGNWCLTAEWGSTQGDKCDTVYDPYEGLSDFLPYAKGVSAKTYDFDEAGNEAKMNYHRLLKMVKNSNFDGYIGIEYEGEKMSEPEGIKATKALIENVWKELE